MTPEEIAELQARAARAEADVADLADQLVGARNAAAAEVRQRAALAGRVRADFMRIIDDEIDRYAPHAVMGDDIGTAMWRVLRDLKTKLAAVKPREG